MTPQRAKHRRYVLRKYGSEKSWDELVDKQGGVCAICKKLTDDLVVDHCHETNRVRGLLCRPCNSGLGCFKDDPKLLKRAVAYLSGGEVSVRVRERRWRTRSGADRSAWVVDCASRQKRWIETYDSREAAERRASVWLSPSA